MSQQSLIRGIGRWDLIAIVINTVIGAGIFGLPSKVAKLIGSYSIIGFVACSLIIFVIALCFAEVSSRFKRSGGAYLYAKTAYGSFAGFEVGWLFWITRFTAFAANCNLLISYLGYFYEPFTQGNLRVFMIGLIVVGLGSINIIGIKQAVLATNILTVGKLVPLVLFVLVGLFFIEPVNFEVTFTPAVDVFANATLVLIYAFVGFESAVVPAGEMKEPRKNAPFSLLTAIGIIVAIYVLVQIVAVGTMPGLADSERPLADAAEVFIGSWGAMIVVIGALISIMGNLNVGVLASSRLLFALGEKGDLPSFFGRTHRRFKTPAIAITTTAVIMFFYTALSSFLAALTISTIIRLLVFASTCAALPVFRYREDAPEARFRAPLGNVVALLSLIFIGWLIYYVRLTDIIQVGVVSLIGAVIFLSVRLTGAARQQN